MNIEKTIRDIPDFPKKGIMFKDITTLLKDSKAFSESIKQMADKFRNTKIDYVVGAESRGFIFGAPLALELNAGFIPIRKPGKLPAETISESYELEYGTDSLEIHKDAIEEGKNVLIVDDLLATGGTAEAMGKLIIRTGGKICSMVFLIELGFLNGRDKLKDYNIESIIKY